jgi:hypothetical protein
VALDFSKKKWWETDVYSQAAPLPWQFDKLDLFGPKEAALVKVYADGSTQKGWGLNPPKGSDEGFMPRYMKGEFLPRRALHRYEEDGEPFAFVMRASRMIVVDIDGKNGGLEFVKELGILPPTLCETSKSGNGYHLWYSTNEDWSETEGFGELPDAIGLVQGVDIRAVGCVYHYDTQRWNDQRLAPVPESLWRRLQEKLQARATVAASIQNVMIQGDETEILMLQDSLIDELAKVKTSAGARNSTLFAIGNKMRMAGVADWETKIHDRALAVGLPADETDRLVANIAKQP